MEIQTRWIPLEGSPVRAYLAAPTRTEGAPAVVLLQEIFGVNSHIRSVAERLAREGFATLAPAIFDRTAPGLELGYTPEAVAEGRLHKGRTTAEQLLGDVRAGAACLAALTGSDKFGLMGFCFGGHVAFLASTLPGAAATASFYGAGIARLRPGGGAPTITDAPRIQGELWAFFGKRDRLIPVEDVQAMEAALKEAEVPHRIFEYDAGHGFFCNERKDYRKEAAEDAWKQTLTLFRRHLI